MCHQPTQVSGVAILRIAFIQETFNPFRGGSQKRVYELGKRLVRRGHEVHVFTVRMAEGWLREDVIDGINVHRIADCSNYLTSDGLRNLYGVFKYISSLSSLDFRSFDAVDVNHCPLFPLLFMGVRERGNVVGTFHECWADEWKKWTGNFVAAKIGCILERASFLPPKICIAVSNFVKKRIIDSFGIDPNKILVLPNGVDTSAYENSHGYKREDKVVFVGRLNPHKRVDLLITAFHLATKDHPSLRLEIIGNGSELHQLEMLSKEFGLREEVRFLTGVSDDEVVDRIKSAKLLVLPSSREGQGIVLLEAMAAGTPVIVTNSSGMNACPEIVAESRGGLISEPIPSTLARDMGLLLEDDNLWKNCSEAGVGYAERHDWNVIAEECEKIYESSSRWKLWRR